MIIFNLIDVIDPNDQRFLKEDFKKSKTNFYSDIKELKDSITYDSIIIATKPNNYVEIL